MPLPRDKCGRPIAHARETLGEAAVGMPSLLLTEAEEGQLDLANKILLGCYHDWLELREEIARLTAKH